MPDSNKFSHSEEAPGPLHLTAALRLSLLTTSTSGLEIRNDSQTVKGAEMRLVVRSAPERG